jgi:hypothetical protein
LKREEKKQTERKKEKKRKKSLIDTQDSYTGNAKPHISETSIPDFESFALICEMIAITFEEGRGARRRETGV